MTDHVEDLLSAFIDNELSEIEREQVEKHINQCTNCAAILSDLMDMKQLVFSAFHAIEVSDLLEDKVLQSISLSASSGTSRSRYWFLVPLLTPLLLIVVAFALMGTVVFKMTSIGVKIMVNLIYAFGGFLGSDPYMLTGLTFLLLLIIIGSSVSLKLLLKTKAT